MRAKDIPLPHRWPRLVRQAMMQPACSLEQVPLFFEGHGSDSEKTRSKNGQKENRGILCPFRPVPRRKHHRCDRTSYQNPKSRMHEVDKHTIELQSYAL